MFSHRDRKDGRKGVNVCGCTGSQNREPGPVYLSVSKDQMLGGSQGNSSHRFAINSSNQENEEI